MISAAIEADIAELDTYEDKQLFLEDMGLDQPGVNKLIRAAYRLLNLVTYFTAGVQEVRAWTITRGMTAPEAAGVIHTDFEKGFIRRSEEHTSELQSLMRNSYAVFCLQKHHNAQRHHKQSSV